MRSGRHSRQHTNTHVRDHPKASARPRARARAALCDGGGRGGDEAGLRGMSHRTRRWARPHYRRCSGQCVGDAVLPDCEGSDRGGVQPPPVLATTALIAVKRARQHNEAGAASGDVRRSCSASGPVVPTVHAAVGVAHRSVAARYEHCALVSLSPPSRVESNCAVTFG